MRFFTRLGRTWSRQVLDSQRIERTHGHALLLEVTEGKWRSANPRTRAHLTFKILRAHGIDTKKRTPTEWHDWLKAKEPK